jgi:hypothetical protein
MKVADSGRLLSLQAGSARITVPEKTTLHETAADILGMVTAYQKDGTTFLSKGDWVNALAAFCYGYGWLHLGVIIGCLDVGAHPCHISAPFERAAPDLIERLHEKSGRYKRLLSCARAAVVPAPEQGTAMYAVAGRVLFITGIYAGQGERFLVQGRAEDALACFSYGHGWLDAAVRAGLLRITAERDLFTV